MNRTPDGWRNWERVAVHAAGMLFVVGICIFMYLILFRPTREAKLRQQQQLAKLQSMIDRKTKAIADYKEAFDKTEALRLRLASFRARLPEQPDVNQLLNELSATARQLDLKVLAIQPTQQLTGELAAIQNVKLRVSGSYESVCRLLDRLRSIHSVVWVLGVKMTSDAAGTQLQPVELELALLFAPAKSLVGQMPIEPAKHQDSST